VTSHPIVGHAVQRTAGDRELRARLARAGATWHTESVVLEWLGHGARVRSSLDGGESVVEADSLVLATTNASATELLDSLDSNTLGADIHSAGDVVAARGAVHAIYEGRTLAMRL
jgi:flavin-dependent dehydrogenase